MVLVHDASCSLSGLLRAESVKSVVSKSPSRSSRLVCFESSCCGGGGGLVVVGTYYAELYSLLLLLLVVVVVVHGMISRNGGKRPVAMLC